ncbi:hypothetical protein [Ramlibacter alkalitolerans]|uniref:YfdX family protein n=1 Tax=Ramlibacter alkalitolerans TaxID=2039631 RepID=A0ABS1JIW5_9BURK|nr:hypothetical protein [Ramlibacter alkalitolerans]MBL0424169.1 hypothetical protein [Ramlibacter alkalitolerans]
MNKSIALRSLLALAGVTLCMASAMAQVRQVPDRDQLERKLTSTSTLIESSTAAKQIEASGNAGAAEKRTRARELHGKARTALAGGDLEGSSKLLDEASRAFIEAVRLAAPQQVADAKERNDYQARLESTRALLDAQKRIAAEKNVPRGAETTRQVETMVAEAERQAQAGRLPEAKRTVDQAYLTVKAAIGTLRGGETVVRSLNFATPADEYAYEVDRNDTHRMLVQMLLKDRRDGNVDAMVDQAVAASAKLRTRAEQEAARRDHPSAIKTLEDSTRELVKAIRAAGVYIPG